MSKRQRPIRNLSRVLPEKPSRRFSNASVSAIRSEGVLKSCEGGVAFTPVGRRDDHAKQHSTHPQPRHPLRHDSKRPAAFPNNGRALSDDVADVFIPILSNGKVKGDKVGPHTDLLTNFPYVGSPHNTRSSELIAA